MNSKEYCNTFDKIVVSEEKIIETSQILNKINNNNKKENVKILNKNHLLIACGFAFCAISILLVATVININSTKVRILDSLSDDVFKETVQLSDGKLFFSKTNYG